MKRAALLVTLAACSNPSPPVIVSTTPSADEIGVDRAVEVAAVFSEDMDPTTIDLVVTLEGEPVAGTLDYDDTSRAARFVPDEPLALLGAYEAVVAGDATSLDGLLLGEDHAWEFTVRDRRWEPAVMVATEASNTRLAVSGEQATIVWERPMAGSAEIRASQFRLSEGWSTERTLSSGEGWPIAPQIVALPDGGALAAWMHAEVVHWSRRDADGSWTPDALVGTSAPTGGFSLGDGIVGWSEGFGPAAPFASRYSVTEGWGAAEPVGAESDAWPVVASRPDGGAIAVWARYDFATTSRTMFSSQYSAAAGWEAEQSLVLPSGVDFTARVAMTSDGGVLLVWDQLIGDPAQERQLWATRLAVGAEWEPPVLLDTDPWYGAEGMIELFVDGADHATVVWVSQNEDYLTDILSSRFSTTDGWSAAQQVATDNSGMDIDGDEATGAITCGWVTYEPGTSHLWSRRLGADGTWGEPIEIASTSTDSSAGLVVGHLASGDAVAVWNTAASLQASVFR